jgi:hypothetical protein
MQRRPLCAALSAVCTLTAVTGCEVGNTAGAAPEPSAIETAAAVVTDTVAVSPQAPPQAPTAAEILAAAVTATRTVNSAHVGYTATGYDTLTATTWSAEVTAAPPAATGSAGLLIDGQRTPTDFTVGGGRLVIQNVDGSRSDVGEAAGVLNPPEILNRITGVAALLETVTDAAVADGPADLNGVPMQKLSGQIAATDLNLLLPTELIDSSQSLPVTLWLDPVNGHTLRQLIATTSNGAIVLDISPTS